MQGRSLVATLVAVLSCAAAQAANLPSPQEIARARGDCFAQKQRVHRLESRLGEDASQIRQARLRWERACADAQAMMDRRAGRPVLQAERPRTRAQAEMAGLERKSCDCPAVAAPEPVPAPN